MEKWASVQSKAFSARLSARWFREDFTFQWARHLFWMLVSPLALWIKSIFFPRPRYAYRLRTPPLVLKKLPPTNDCGHRCRRSFRCISSIFFLWIHPFLTLSTFLSLSWVLPIISVIFARPFHFFGKQKFDPQKLSRISNRESSDKKMALNLFHLERTKD